MNPPDKDEEILATSKKDFDARLKRARDSNGIGQIGGNVSSDLQGKGLAFRIGTELVVAIILGGVIGFFLDTLLETKPWFLIVFLFLGNAAGLWNIFKVTKKQGDTIGFRKSKI